MWSNFLKIRVWTKSSCCITVSSWYPGVLRLCVQPTEWFQLHDIQESKAIEITKWSVVFKGITEETGVNRYSTEDFFRALKSFCLIIWWWTCIICQNPQNITPRVEPWKILGEFFIIEPWFKGNISGLLSYSLRIDVYTLRGVSFYLETQGLRMCDVMCTRAYVHTHIKLEP